MIHLYCLLNLNVFKHICFCRGQRTLSRTAPTYGQILDHIRLFKCTTLNRILTVHMCQQTKLRQSTQKYNNIISYYSTLTCVVWQIQHRVASFDWQIKNWPESASSSQHFSIVLLCKYFVTNCSKTLSIICRVFLFFNAEERTL